MKNNDKLPGKSTNPVKKLFVCILCIAAVLSFSGCKNEKENKSDVRVTTAIEKLSEYWSECYDEFESRGETVENRYLEIVNTKLINIKDEIDSENFAKQKEMFEDIDYIIEFELISNYYGSQPYYSNVMQKNCVVVYKNGKVSVENNLFNIYRATTYSTDFSDIIESIEEFHGEYDQVIEIE